MSNPVLEQTDRRLLHPPWYLPTVSPEHGIYIVLLVSFLIGAAVAQAWNMVTLLALICAFCGFQAEHPLVLQIKQRSSWKPRFLFWGSVYGGIAATIALYLYVRSPILIWIYGAAIAALLVDAISVFHREQKSIFNELITFAAVCLTIPLVEAAATGTISITAIALWILTTLFFSSTIFTVKLRKPKTKSITPGTVYHAIAALVIFGLWWVGVLNPIAASAFGIAMLKFSTIAWQSEWYRSLKIQSVAVLETASAFLFALMVVLSILPAYL
jgi:hypothetical protein